MSRVSSLIALLPFLGLSAALAGAGGTDPDSSPLPAAERAAVRELVEKELQKRGLLKGKAYLTGIDVPPDNHPDRPRRALVTHYRYDGDLAILTAVDLDRRAVLSVDAIPHMTTSQPLVFRQGAENRQTTLRIPPGDLHVVTIQTE